MSRTIRANDAAAVHRENHRQVLKRHIVLNLVIGTLGKGGIDRDHGLHAAAGKTRGVSHGMLFRDRHIPEPLRETLRKLVQVRAFRHGRGDRVRSRILLRGITDPAAEHVGERRSRTLLRLHAGLRIKVAHAVVRRRIRFRKLVPLPLLRHHVEHNRAPLCLQILKHADQVRNIVSIDRPEIIEVERGEEGGRRRHKIHRLLLKAFREFPETRKMRQHLLRPLPRSKERRS